MPENKNKVLVDIDELDRLEKAATATPWIVEEDNTIWLSGERNEYGHLPYENRIVEIDSGVYPPETPDAVLIVAMRNALPALLLELRSRREAEKVSRELMDDIERWCSAYVIAVETTNYSERSGLGLAKAIVDAIEKERSP